MTLFKRPITEHEAKLELLLSISRSQNAIARILDSMADVTAYSEETAQLLARHADRMVHYQQAMATMLTGITLYRQYVGIPSSPWINARTVTPLNAISKEDDSLHEYRSEEG